MSANCQHHTRAMWGHLYRMEKPSSMSEGMGNSLAKCKERRHILYTGVRGWNSYWRMWYDGHYLRHNPHRRDEFYWEPEQASPEEEAEYKRLYGSSCSSRG